MRIPSGKTDVYLYFVAVDPTDLKTREAGLSGFTVYRSRNGAAEVQYTTPTVTEIDATNMPGVYALLIDEDTTITSGADSEEVCVHITQASMAPVTRTFELYRREVTSGQTITVANGCADADIERLQGNVIATPTQSGVLEVDLTHIAGSAVSTSTAQLGVNVVNAAGTAWGSGAITAASIASDAITAAKIANGAIDAATFATGAIDAAALAADAGTEIATAVWASGTRSLTVLDEDSTTLDLDATIRAAVGLASANLDTQLDALPTAAENADAVWDEDATGHQTGGTFGQAIGDPGANTETLYKAIVTDPAGTNIAADIIAIKAETANILTDTAEIGVAGAGLTNINLPDQTMNITGNITGNLSGSVGSVTGNVGGNVTGSIGSLATQAKADVNAEVDTALADYDAPTKAELDTGLDALPTAGENADAVWRELIADHDSVAGSTAEALSDAGGAGTPPTVEEIRQEMDANSTQLSGIKTKTDSLTFTVAGKVDSNVLYVNGTQVTGDGQSGSEWGPA